MHGAGGPGLPSRSLCATACLVVLLGTLPASAQLLPHSRSSTHAADVKACMMDHMSGLRGRMQAHMSVFLATHPGARESVLKAEFHRFKGRLRNENPEIVSEVRRICGG
jgi:hypothetical protein